MHRHFRLPQAEQPTHPIGAPVAIELVEALEHVDLLVFEDLAAVRDTEAVAAARRHFRLPQAEQPIHPIGALVAIELVEALGHFNLLVFEDLAAVRDTVNELGLTPSGSRKRSTSY